MKIAQLSDIHYCDKHLEEVDRCMAFAVDYLINNVPGLIVLSGDTFDHKLDQNSPSLFSAIESVSLLANIAPVLILQGTLSHDVPHAIDIFRNIQAGNEIKVVDVIQQVVLDDGLFRAPFIKKNSLLISCLPSINKGHVAAAVGAESAAGAVGEQVANLLKSWAPLNEKVRKEDNVATIVISHGTVSGSLTEHGVPMAGLDHEFSIGALFAAQASAVMLGHIHKCQGWEREGRRIAYPGSLGRLHFGEMDAKGFLMWDVTAAGATYELIQTPAKELIEITYAGTPDMADLARRAAAAPKNAHVRVRWAVDEEHRASVDKAAIASLFSGVAEIKLEGRILPVQRQRAAGIGEAPSLHDKLKRWCEVTNTPYDPLAERLSLVLGGTQMEIAA